MAGDGKVSGEIVGGSCLMAGDDKVSGDIVGGVVFDGRGWHGEWKGCLKGVLWQGVAG